jgi:hypothetical protein
LSLQKIHPSDLTAPSKDPIPLHSYISLQAPKRGRGRFHEQATTDLPPFNVHFSGADFLALLTPRDSFATYGFVPQGIYFPLFPVIMMLYLSHE